MALTRNAIKILAEETVGQYKNPKWFQVRLGKLLTSNFDDAVKMCDKIENLSLMDFQSVQYFIDDELRLRRSWLTHSELTDKYPWLRWGITKEPYGILEYESQSNFKVRPTGVWIFPSGNVCGSPDGLVYENEKSVEPIGIIEVKCPWRLRNFKHLDDGDFARYLDYVGHDIKLIKTHKYYSTIQGNLHATKMKWCDLVVWTPVKTIVIRVDLDNEWLDRNIPRIENYYTKWLVPAPSSSSI